MVYVSGTRGLIDNEPLIGPVREAMCHYVR